MFPLYIIFYIMQVCFFIAVCSVCEELVSGNNILTFSSSISLTKNVFTVGL